MNKITLMAAVGAIALATPLMAQGRGRNHDGVPPGQRPPAGMCRIWINGVPPGQQPAPTDCATAVANRPANARVIYGDRTHGRASRSDRTIYNSNGTITNGNRGVYNPNGTISNGTRGVYNPNGTINNGGRGVYNGGVYNPSASSRDIYGNDGQVRANRDRDDDNDQGDRARNRKHKHKGDRDHDGDDSN